MAAAESNQLLTPAVLRLLQDKLYERRKVAALEIEKVIRASAAEQRTEDVKKVIDKLCNEFTLSQNPNSRKGGLIGLAACAIALGNQDITPFLENLIHPVLICSVDQDSRIRYFACESLYNIVKIARAETIPFFNKLFDALSKLTADPDPNVRNGSDLLDRLLKDIVSEFPNFDVTNFMALLCDRIYTRNQFTRRFLMQWLTFLDSVPEINILIYLPKFLEALFEILGDPSPEIKRMCEATLDQILNNIQKEVDVVQFDQMVNILIIHSQSEDDNIKVKAISWIQKFIDLAGAVVIRYSSGVLTAILPTLSYEDLQHKDAYEAAKSANSSLMKLVDNSYDVLDKESVDGNALPLRDVIDVLKTHLQHKSTSTKIAVIRWITHLLLQIPHRIFSYINDIFNHLMNTLTDNSDKVVLLALECLAELVSSPGGAALSSSSCNTSSLVLNIYFKNMMVSLLKMFKNDTQFMENRCSFIVRRLSLLLNAESIFRVFAEILMEEKDCKFASRIVQLFNIILMTSRELFELRGQLKKAKSKESSQIFCVLYKSWCHNPVATVSLCLLSQSYKHAYELLMKFADVEITVDFLTEVDKLIQLLESPIFTYLRLQLLKSDSNQYLLKCMYALLMLLPQSRSFEVLQHRLSCLPSPQMLPAPNGLQLNDGQSANSSSDSDNQLSGVDFQELLNHFVLTQERHVGFQQRKSIQAAKDVPEDGDSVFSSTI